MIVYKATNKINGGTYIGITTKTLNARKAQHEYASKFGSRTYFHRALRLHGRSNFMWEVLDTTSSTEELKAKEIHYISLYKSVSKNYNMTLGGDGSFGRKHTEETLLKMSKALKGKKLSQERKDHLREINLGCNNPNFGKTASKETKLKMSNAKLGKNHPRAKSYWITPFGIFNSGGEAARALNMKRNTVYYRCKTDKYIDWSIERSVS